MRRHIYIKYDMSYVADTLDDVWPEHRVLVALLDAATIDGVITRIKDIGRKYQNAYFLYEPDKLTP